MSKEYMNSSLNMEGELCGVKTTLLAGCIEDELLFSAEVEITKDSLKELLKLFGSVTKEKVGDYVELLNDFEVKALFAHSNQQTMLEVRTEALKFLAYDGKQGKLVAFALLPQEIINGENDSLAQVVKKVMYVFGIHSFTFLYRNTNINCSELYKAYSYLPEVPPIIEGSLLLSTAFRFDEVAKYPFTDAMRTIFGINQMDIFVGLGGKQVSCALLVPDIENALLSCQNIVIYTQFGSNNVKFQMAGAIGLSCFPGLKFYVNAEFTLTNVSISASTMPTSVYQIPNTKISICNCGLELGFGKSGINIGAMSQINIRNLMWYGALSISYNGTVPMLDMINIAMSEVSVSSLVSNLAGIDSQSVKELDIFTVTAFDINSSGGGKTIDFKTLTDAEIIQAVNNALAGMKQEYLLSQDNVSVTRLPGDSACDVLNTKTMFHYWLNSKGELSFPPQAYYASKHLTIGRYNFDMGVFFAGQLEIFGQKIKVMFSSVNDKGILGYAEVSPIHNSVLIISGSRSEKNRINPVLGSTSNSTLELLTQDFYRNEVTDRPVTLYMDVSKNACNFYIDGHIELCKIFSFDALVYFANKNIRIAVETSYFNLFRASLYLNADYQKMKNLFFEFEVSLDSTGLQNNLKQLTYLLDEAVTKYEKKIHDAQKKINDAKNKVSSLQNEINSYKSKIEECRRVIRKAKWYQWAKMAKETAKIVGYEVAIGGIYLAMKTAEAALDAANKVLSLANKLGSGFLNTINKVIQGVLNVFYISKALLGIIVNGSQIFVKVNMELTVIGKQISVKEEVDMNKLIEKPIILLEELTINQIKDLIDMLSLGQTPEYERIEATPYPYMEFPEDPVELSEMVAYGAKRIEQAKGMVEELQDLYIDELQELDSEIEDMDTEFKAAAQMVSYSLEKASDNVYIDGMDELITQIEEAKEDGQISPEEIKLAESCIDDYLNIIRPSATTIEESSMRVKECVDSIDTERTTKRMRSSYKNADAENGTELMNNRDYDKFYGELQSVVEKYFPHGSGHGYFNITDEEVFYQALNNARKQAGCAYVELSEEDEEENQESGLLYGAKPLRRMVSEGYIQRLQ